MGVWRLCVCVFFSNIPFFRVGDVIRIWIAAQPFTKLTKKPQTLLIVVSSTFVVLQCVVRSRDVFFFFKRREQSPPKKKHFRKISSANEKKNSSTIARLLIFFFLQQVVGCWQTTCRLKQNEQKSLSYFFFSQLVLTNTWTKKW